MDKKKSILNVFFSVFFKVVLMVLSLLVRRSLIKNIGNSVNGLNSLYQSIIGFLSVMELGVGSAISFSMYKPIVNGDYDEVSALYKLFNKLYLIIGMLVLSGGIIITPFIPYLAKDYAEININVYLTFFLLLVSVVITYFFGAKISLLNAFKNNYISTAISSIGLIFQYIFQLMAIRFFKSYICYLVIIIISALIQWILTEIIVRKTYNEILKNKAVLKEDTKKNVTKNIKAMFLHKIGGTLVGTVDSMVISTLIGVVVLGKFTNYTVILGGASGILVLVFTSLSSVLGHLCASEDNDTIFKYFGFFHTLNFVLGIIFFLGYYSIIDNLINIIFGENLLLDNRAVIIITINGFVQFMRYSAAVFKDATGAFYNDRWIPFIEGIANLLLSIVFVLLLPEQYAVSGVLVATIITNLLICHVEEPYYLFKYGLKDSSHGYFARNYFYIFVFCLSLILLSKIHIYYDNDLISLLVNGFISIFVSGAISAIAIFNNKFFISIIKRTLIKVFSR